MRFKWWKTDVVPQTVSTISTDAPSIYCEQAIEQGLRSQGVEVDIRGLCTPEWIEQVRGEAGGGFLTVRHPAILAAIEREVNARLTGEKA